MSKNKTALSILAAATCSGVLLAAPARADSPLGKTIDVNTQACANGTCTPMQRIHIYVSASGQVYSFANRQGGRKSGLGETFTTGNGAGRFSLAGNAILFDGIMAQNNNTLRARATVAIHGRHCSVNWQAEFNGSIVPMETRSGPCRVFRGQKPF